MGSKLYNRKGYDNEETPKKKEKQHVPGQVTSAGQAAEYIRKNKQKKQAEIDKIMKDL